MAGEPNMVTGLDPGERIDFHLSMSTKLPPSDEEWEVYLHLLVAHMERHFGEGRLRCVVLTDGGVPTSPQRRLIGARLAKWESGRGKVLIVSNNATARMVA